MKNEIPLFVNRHPLRFFDSPSGDRIAYREVAGSGPTILWLGGFLSDMTGSKIEAIGSLAESKGWGFVCFDYFAHGETGGDFNAASVGRWRQNVMDVVDHLTSGPLVCIGSSMGGHMTALVIKHRQSRVLAAGFIAPAPDFATELLLKSLSPEDLHGLKTSGVYMMPGYDRDVPITQAFFDEAFDHLVLDAPLVFEGKIRILHGQKDDVVPWQHGLRLAQAITGPDVVSHLIKDGDHRLSRPQDLERMADMVTELRAISPKVPRNVSAVLG